MGDAGSNADAKKGKGDAKRFRCIFGFLFPETFFKIRYTRHTLGKAGRANLQRAMPISGTQAYR